MYDILITMTDKSICKRCKCEFKTSFNRYTKTDYKECDTCRQTRVRKIKRETLDYEPVQTFEPHNLYAALTRKDRLVIMYVLDNDNIELNFYHDGIRTTMNTSTIPKLEFMHLEACEPYRRVNAIKLYFDKLYID